VASDLAPSTKMVPVAVPNEHSAAEVASAAGKQPVR